MIQPNDLHTLTKQALYASDGLLAQVEGDIDAVCIWEPKRIAEMVSRDRPAKVYARDPIIVRVRSYEAADLAPLRERVTELGLKPS